MHLAIYTDDELVVAVPLRDGDDTENSRVERDVLDHAYEVAQRHPEKIVEIRVDLSEPSDDEPTREVLVHLNLELPAETEGDAHDLADRIEREIQGALEVGVDPDETPTLAAAKIVVALVDPI